MFLFLPCGIVLVLISVGAHLALPVVFAVLLLGVFPEVDFVVRSKLAENTRKRHLGLGTFDRRVGGGLSTTSGVVRRVLSGFPSLPVECVDEALQVVLGDHLAKGGCNN